MKRSVKSVLCYRDAIWLAVLSSIFVGCVAGEYAEEVARSGPVSGPVENHGGETEAIITGQSTVTQPAYRFEGLYDWNHDGHMDLVATELETEGVYLYPGDSRRAISGFTLRLVWFFRSLDRSVGVTDWNLDGRPDLLQCTSLFEYLILDAPQYYAANPLIQCGCLDRSYAGISDWNHDGFPALVARDNVLGNLYLYLGRGWKQDESALVPPPPGLPCSSTSPPVTSTDPGVQIGSEWFGLTFAGTADWNNDGYIDVIARQDSNGNLYVYPGAAAGYLSTRYQIGNGWNGFTFAGVADWDNDGYVDIIARRDLWPYYLWLYPGQGVLSYSTETPVILGVGW